MLAALGVKVTLLDERPMLLDFVDREMIESLCFQLRQIGTVFRLGEKAVSVAFDSERDRVFAKLEAARTSAARRCCSLSDARPIATCSKWPPQE
jgi:NAD(P) transhydrogenase